EVCVPTTRAGHGSQLRDQSGRGSFGGIEDRSCRGAGAASGRSDGARNPARDHLGTDDHRSGGGPFNSTFVICHWPSLFSSRTPASWRSTAGCPPRGSGLATSTDMYARAVLSESMNTWVSTNRTSMPAAGGFQAFTAPRIASGDEISASPAGTGTLSARWRPTGTSRAILATSLSPAGTDNAAATSPICRLRAREGLNHH